MRPVKFNENFARPMVFEGPFPTLSNQNLSHRKETNVSGTTN